MLRVGRIAACLTEWVVRVAQENRTDLLTRGSARRESVLERVKCVGVGLLAFRKVDPDHVDVVPVRKVRLEPVVVRTGAQDPFSRVGEDSGERVENAAAARAGDDMLGEDRGPRVEMNVKEVAQCSKKAQ